MYRLEWPWRAAGAALDAMQTLMDGAPDTLSCRVGFDVSGGGPATGGTPKRGVSALGLYFGPSHELAELLAPVLAAVWPSVQVIEDRSYLAAAAALAGNVPFDRFASKSRFLDGPLPGAGIDTAVRWIERWPGSSNPGGAGITLFAWGGAINGVAPAATAFVHRGAAFLMDSETTWTARDSPPVVSANLDWLAGLYHALAPFGTAPGVPELHRPGAAGLEDRVLRREPAPADRGQAPVRPRRRVPVRPVHPRAPAPPPRGLIWAWLWIGRRSQAVRVPAGAAGERRGYLGPGVNTEPHEYLIDVEFDRLDTDIKLCRDVPVGFPAGHGPRHDQLAGSQRRLGGQRQ